jgi:MOSC domain-containing protein YiiM
MESLQKKARHQPMTDSTLQTPSARPLTLLSVNVGSVQPIKHAKPSGKTGIYKQPSAAPVQIDVLGLEGDAIVDTENHGGIDQAVYVFTQPDYAWWSAHIGRAILPGTFGENLTLSGLESSDLYIGDRFQIGDVVIEITSPRVPCVTIAARMEDPSFVKKFRRAERPGAYCRVIVPGPVQAGAPLTHIPFEGERIGLVEMFRQNFQRSISIDEVRRYLKVPIHYKTREYYEALLESAPGQRE